MGLCTAPPPPEAEVFVDGHFEMRDSPTAQRTCIKLCWRVLQEIDSNVQTTAVVVLMIHITEALVTPNSQDQLCFITNSVSWVFHILSARKINKNKRNKLKWMKFKKFQTKKRGRGVRFGILKISLQVQDGRHNILLRVCPDPYQLCLDLKKIKESCWEKLRNRAEIVGLCYCRNAVHVPCVLLLLLNFMSKWKQLLFC